MQHLSTSSVFFSAFLALAAPAYGAIDFDGDGKGDMIYRGDSDLKWRIDLMDGLSIKDSFDMPKMSSCCGWLFNGSGDFNNDGYNDVIIRNIASGEWYIYNLKGSQMVSRGYVPIESAIYIGVQAVADFNNDGYDDVLLRNEKTGEWTMSLIQNRTLIQEYLPPMSKVLSWQLVDAKDFDGNGSADILIRNNYAGTWYIYLYENTNIIGRGYITEVLPTDTREEFQAVGDFNGDGKYDVLFRNLDSNEWSIALMDGRAPISMQKVALNTNGAWELNGVEDFDGDGKYDISLRNRNTKATYSYLMDSFNVNMEASSTELRADASLQSLITRSRPNALIENISPPGFHQQKDNSYENSNPDLWVNFYQASGDGTSPGDARAYLDINQDGLLDVLSFIGHGQSEFDYQTAQFLINNGEDGFDKETSHWLGEPLQSVHPRKALTADFNGDGKADVFVIGHGYDKHPFPGEVMSYMLSEEGGYRSYKLPQTGFWHGGGAGDIDGDGDIDVVAVTGGDDFSMFINDGDGNFTYKEAPFKFESLGYYTADLIDFNGDGNLDLWAGGHEFEGAVNIVYLGDGKGNFNQDGVRLPVNNNGYGIILDFDFADIDGDGDKDIVLNRVGDPENGDGFYVGYEVELLLNDGELNFSRHSALMSDPTGWFNWVRVKDYNGDGKPDVFEDDKQNGRMWINNLK